jgi:hypothetical protein
MLNPGGIAAQTRTYLGSARALLARRRTSALVTHEVGSHV